MTLKSGFRITLLACKFVAAGFTPSVPRLRRGHLPPAGGGRMGVQSDTHLNAADGVEIMESYESRIEVPISPSKDRSYGR
jgi:hypothetical protein